MRSDTRPVYLRLRDILADAILDGEHGEGDPVPSVRAFAAMHGANPLTVARAYQGLQDDGLLIARRGVGLFIAPGARAKLLARERDVFLKDEWPAIARRIQRLKLDVSELT
jgi:GntR family transcriptional regulator